MSELLVKLMKDTQKISALITGEDINKAKMAKLNRVGLTELALIHKEIKENVYVNSGEIGTQAYYLKELLSDKYLLNKIK